MKIDFSGKNVLVTGASSGIGKATAIEFAEAGASVVLNYHKNQTEAEETVARIRAAGGTAHAVGADLSQRAGAIYLFEQTRLLLGDRLDVLVNNAGTLIERRSLETVTDTLWQNLFDVNVSSTFWCSQLALPMLRNSQQGRIVNVTSVAARNGGSVGAGPYASMKAAVLTLTKNFAKELAPLGITVNGVAPGVISTPFHDKLTPPEMRARMVENIPLKREGTPQETAYGILFLASDQARYITGETLEINGGINMD